MITPQHLRAGFAVFDAVGLNQPQAWKRLDPDQIEQTWCAVLADVTPEEFQAAVLLLSRDDRAWYPTAGIVATTVQKRIRAMLEDPTPMLFKRIRGTAQVVPYNDVSWGGRTMAPEDYWQFRLDQEFDGSVPEHIQNAIDRCGGLNFFRGVRDDEMVWRLKDFERELEGAMQLRQVEGASQLLLR